MKTGASLLDDITVSRRRSLGLALASTAALAVGRGAGAANAGLTNASPTPSDRGGGTAAEPGWSLMFDLTVRFPAGRLDDWRSFWGDRNVPLLEKKGQWLWGAWTSLTGQQNTVTHQWAYRDLAHYQAMAAMRSADDEVRSVAKDSVPIEENILSSVMSPLPYHPSPAPPAAREAGILATHRIFPSASPRAREHISLSAEYVSLARRHGAQLRGAFQSFFGWTPSYILQVWRYESLEHFARVRRAIATDSGCQRLLTELRSIYPHETVELQQPLPYSRLR